MNQDQARLEDIRNASRRIQTFVEGVDFDTFRADELLQSAVIFQLLILGEASKHLSEEFRSSYEDIPWSKMARMRDRLVHGYFDLDFEVIWTTATRDVTALTEMLDEIPE